MPSPIQTVAKNSNSVLLVTSRSAHESRKSYLFTNPDEVFVAKSIEDIPPLLQKLDEAPRKNLYAAGYFGYECGYAIESKLLSIAPKGTSTTPLAWFGFYHEPVVFDYVQEPVPKISLPTPSLNISENDYLDRFRKVKAHIKLGNTYQVNLTTRLRWQNNVDGGSLFNHLMSVQPVEFGAFINIGDIQILSASPELFFRRKNNHIIARPMKGTATRGFSITEQRENAKWLANDEKNRSENIMIVDLLRNDLRRICQANSVNVTDLCVVEIYPTVLQMISSISGQLRSSVAYSDIFRALFPCGSITGAPKVRTMQIIREVEDTPRGVYTGTIGFISPFDEAVFNVAIRTLVLADGIGEMGIGGGIVWDSDAEEEYNECLLKAKFLNLTSAKFDLIETILWDGEYKFLSEHISRLSASAEFFGYLFDLSQVISRLKMAARSFPSTLQRVRVLLSSDGRIQISNSVIKLSKPSRGITVLLSSRCTDPNDLFLRHKTTHRPLYDSEFCNAQSAGYDDAIFLNCHGHLTEGAIHNIFIVTGGKWITPPVSDGLLPGILRGSMFEGRITERSVTLEDLISADEVYLGNSVRGLRRVEKIDKIGDKGVFHIWQRKCQENGVLESGNYSH